jgi:hypothetical protein
MVWPRQKDARGENNKINYGMIPEERRKRGRPRKTWMEGVQAAMTTRTLEPDQWRNREEWVFRRRRRLLQNQIDYETPAPPCFEPYWPFIREHKIVLNICLIFWFEL